MRERYCCQVCMKLFPVGEAIDGYGSGVKRGFLCPHCNSNLIEAGESDDILNLEYGFTFMALNVLLTWLVFNEVISFALLENSLANELLNLLVVLFLPALFFVVINRDVLFKPRIIYTRKA